MKVTYDEKADAMYIKFTEAEYEVSKEIQEGIIFDMDKKGSIIGIEILDASQKLPKKSLHEMDFKLLGEETAEAQA